MIEYLAQADKKPTLFVNVFAGVVMQGEDDIFSFALWLFYVGVSDSVSG